MRTSRLTLGLFAVAFGLLAPSSALGAQSLAITSATGFPAGGHPTYTTSIGLDTRAGTPSTVTIKLAPGVLASPSAAPSCVQTTQHTASCEIGKGSVAAGLAALGLPLPSLGQTLSRLGLPLPGSGLLPGPGLLPKLAIPVTAYLAPPPDKADVVGIDVVPVTGGPVTHAGARLVQNSSGNVQTVLNLSLSGLNALAGLVTGMNLTIDGTLGGKAFNRMPTNCSPGQSQVTVVYTNKTETVAASPDFRPTGCSSLPYAPKLSGTAHAVSHGGAGKVVTTITQAAGQAASSKTTLVLPNNALLPSPGALGFQNTSTPVASVVARTPLLPTPLKGKIFLKGTLAKPSLVFKFPPPAALTLTGAVNLAADSMTIPVIPDVPLTKLQVTFPGGRDGMLIVGCPTKPAKLVGTFTSQSGRTVKVKHALTVTGCKG
jgi:hypothetical protein